VRVLNFDFDEPFDNMWDWKGIEEKSGGINITKAYVTNENTFR
jgi:hypothetical protein